MILLLHNRYRTLGGEERVVEELMRILPEELGEEVLLLERGSAELSSAHAALGMLRGGIDPGEVSDAVRRHGARVVHAHNVNPAFGWRALAAARKAGARTVLHLHQYRLVCATGTCLDPSDHDCTRCHGRRTFSGVRLRCRGSLPEAAIYGAALPMWSRKLVEQADALVTPSNFTIERLRTMGAPLEGREVTVIANPVRLATRKADPPNGKHAIVSARFSRDKGVDVAIEACALAGVPLVITGEGPDETELRALAQRLGADVRFVGRVPDEELEELRATAALAIVPSRFAETFGLSAAESMACALPVVGTRVGALTDLLEPENLVAPGDARALADAVRRRYGNAAAGLRNAKWIAHYASPQNVARSLAAVYDG